jgi:hypothetical protein
MVERNRFDCKYKHVATFTDQVASIIIVIIIIVQ